MKKGKRIVVLLLSVFFLPDSNASAVLSVTPSSFSVPGGQSSVLTVTYQFTGPPSVNTVLTSPGGTFTAGLETISSVHRPITISIKAGSGRISETVQIPVSLIDKTLSRGFTAFAYARNFSGSGTGPLTSVVHFTVTTEADAGFALTKITLYFDNKRPEVLVERNQQLKAYADIDFVGSGLLQGYWEVDGRVLTHVNQHLTFGGGNRLQTLTLPSLPAFDTGTHIVRFVVTNPAVSIPAPTILYFIFPEGATCSVKSLAPVEPPDNFAAPYGPLRFAWSRGGDTTMYVIGFYSDKEPDSKPVFSAYVRETSYTLPEQVIRSFFQPGRPYYWKIQGFDKESAMICDGTMQKFSFRQKG